MKKFIVITPTYNESENISKLIPRILDAGEDVSVLVVDDNSPDGTGDIVTKISESNPRVHVLHRKGKEGLGKAYLAGMDWAIKQGYEFLVQMDADHSHRPEDLKEMLKQAESNDLVIGSRWVNGGGVVNWPLHRKFISRFGSFYSRTILGHPLRDWTGGFNLWRCSKLKTYDFESVRSNGYSFQIEMKYRAVKKGFRTLEHPITFVERESGVSKMSNKIIVEALFKVWSFRKQKI